MAATAVNSIAIDPNSVKLQIIVTKAVDPLVKAVNDYVEMARQELLEEYQKDQNKTCCRRFSAFLAFGAGVAGAAVCGSYSLDAQNPDPLYGDYSPTRAGLVAGVFASVLCCTTLAVHICCSRVFCSTKAAENKQKAKEEAFILKANALKHLSMPSFCQHVIANYKGTLDQTKYPSIVDYVKDHALIEGLYQAQSGLLLANRSFVDTHAN